MTTHPLAVGYLTDVQRRRVQALAGVVALLPHASASYQTQVAFWVVTGRWPS